MLDKLDVLRSSPVRGPNNLSMPTFKWCRMGSLQLKLVALNKMLWFPNRLGLNVSGLRYSLSKLTLA